jgi:hypothetical protein
MGAVLLPLIAIYLALLGGATRRGWYWAKNRGWRGYKQWLAAVCGFLFVYLPVFWDWIPTVVAHHYYCEKQAGFWVYKTVEQWKSENPGVMETLVENTDFREVKTNWGDAMVLNQQFLHLHKFEGPLPMNQWRISDELRDKKNGEVIAREINFLSSQERPLGGWYGWKFWLNDGTCTVQGHRDQGSFGQVITQFVGEKK